MVSIYHIGAQKCGTTWLYRSMVEHPEVCSPPVDSIHFFDLNYHKGFDWYHKQFKKIDKCISFDPTYTYLRNSSCAERIHDYNPRARIMFTARNPIERAFSHYWHEKKKDRFNFTFDEVFKNYDLFTNWIEPGFYSHHYKNYVKHFPKDQIKILFFDDLEENPLQFIQEVYNFCGIDEGFVPSGINRKVNVASSFQSRRSRSMEESLSKFPRISNLLAKVSRKSGSPKEQLSDYSLELKQNLLSVFLEDIGELEKISQRDLSSWKIVC